MPPYLVRVIYSGPKLDACPATLTTNEARVGFGDEGGSRCSLGRWLGVWKRERASSGDGDDVSDSVRVPRSAKRVPPSNSSASSY